MVEKAEEQKAVVEKQIDLLNSLNLGFNELRSRRQEMKLRLGIFFFLILAGCASSPQITDIRSGMRPTEVQKLMGEPSDRAFQGSLEKWYYPHSEKGKVRLVVFDKNRVVKMAVIDADQVDAEMTKEREKGLCVGKNTYGKYEEGGGCNMYGCWPAGGFCNGFGCTSSGRCSSKGCPKKISSFKCTD